jgi:hypothetical protein
MRAVKVLRLTNSSDIHPGVRPELRAPAVAERYIAEATGERVETIQRALWPTETFPAVVERWLDQHEPDVVLVRLSSFWVAYESVPLRIGNRLGRMGGPVTTAGIRIGDRPWLVERKAFKAARKVVVRTVGGDTYFTPAEAAGVLEETFRRIVARESVLPVVRGTGLILNSSGTKAGFQRSLARVAELNRLTLSACEKYHIAFSPEEPSEVESTSRQADELHDAAGAHALIGAAEGKLIAEAWLAGRASIR